jgi:hypothetical protein
MQNMVINIVIWTFGVIILTYLFYGGNNKMKKKELIDILVKNAKYYIKNRVIQIFILKQV